MVIVEKPPFLKQNLSEFVYTFAVDTVVVILKLNFFLFRQN